MSVHVETSASHPTIVRDAAITQRPRWQKRAAKLAGGIAWHAVMLVVCAFVLVPIVMVVLGSFKSVNEFFDKPYGLPQSFDFFNYRKAWAEADLQRATWNSLLSTVLGVILSTSLACLAAYGLARFNFKLRMTIRLVFIGGLVVPVQLIIIPIFIMFRQAGLLGSIWSLVLVYSVVWDSTRGARSDWIFRRFAEGSRGRGANRRRQPLPDLLADHAPAHPPRHCRGRDPQWRLDVERFLPGIDLADASRIANIAGRDHGISRHLHHRVGPDLRQRHDLDPAGRRRLPAAVASVHRGTHRGKCEGLA